jgi:hypothetical protein
MVAPAISDTVLERHFARVLSRPPLHFHFGRSESGVCVAPTFVEGKAAAAAAAVVLPRCTVFFAIAKDIEPLPCASACSASLAWPQTSRGAPCDVVSKEIVSEEGDLVYRPAAFLAHLDEKTANIFALGTKMTSATFVDLEIISAVLLLHLEEKTATIVAFRTEIMDDGSASIESSVEAPQGAMEGRIRAMSDLVEVQVLVDTVYALDRAVGPLDYDDVDDLLAAFDDFAAAHSEIALSAFLAHREDQTDSLFALGSKFFDLAHPRFDSGVAESDGRAGFSC